MGYAGKWQERERARALRAQAWTLQEIATELGVAKGSVSVWVRDVEFTPKPRNRGHGGCQPHPLTIAKEAEIERLRGEADEWVRTLSPHDLHLFALGLYAGEGSKTKGEIALANTNPKFLLVFVTWLRRLFEVDESRLRVVLYLHQDLDLDAAVEFWSTTLAIPASQFGKPYRAVVDGSIRTRKHVYGCATVRYGSTSALRRVLAEIEAIACWFANPG